MNGTNTDSSIGNLDGNVGTGTASTSASEALRRPELVLEFTKMNGAGNDFIVIDNRFFAFSGAELSSIARRFCPRRTSVGADGVLALETRGLDDGVDFRMRYYNADGSLGSMCGNGARCLVKFAFDAGLFPAGTCAFLTDAGLYKATVLSGGDVRLFVPAPADYHVTKVPVPDSIQMQAEAAHYIWTGTEHAVCFVQDVEAYAVDLHGPALRRRQEFGPNGANVNFVEVAETADVVTVRTFEKGVESETLACGTGAIAAASVAYLTGQVQGKKITVRMPGGTLTVGFEPRLEGWSDVFLEGPAATVYRGSLGLTV